jgi:hypothetical protein
VIKIGQRIEKPRSRIAGNFFRMSADHCVQEHGVGICRLKLADIASLSCSTLRSTSQMTVTAATMINVKVMRSR